MSIAVPWKNMHSFRRDAVIAELIVGWKWFEYEFHDVTTIRGQKWLLPDVTYVDDLSPGEWDFYLPRDVGPNGFGPPKDNRLIPCWIPKYSTRLDVIWPTIDIFLGPDPRGDPQARAFFLELGDFLDDNEITMYWETFRNLTAEKICIAMLKAKGCVVGE